MCSVPRQRPKLRAGLDVGKEMVISGRVIDDSGQLVGGAFVRLLDSSDEFAAEVVASGGYFRIFAAPRSWTVRAWSTIIGSGHAAITIESPGIPRGGHQNRHLDRWLLDTTRPRRARDGQRRNTSPIDVAARAALIAKLIHHRPTMKVPGRSSHG